jgi:hypothetical protein
LVPSSVKLLHQKRLSLAVLVVLTDGFCANRMCVCYARHKERDGMLTCPPASSMQARAFAPDVCVNHPWLWSLQTITTNTTRAHTHTLSALWPVCGTLTCTHTHTDTQTYTHTNTHTHTGQSTDSRRALPAVCALQCAGQTRRA